ncbi:MULTISPECIES: hypothetical protein [unclassified Microcoleus]|uniref:hypothetical protein n=1 Tax=unclassified Microcoleus TaxID=2642155 RepID=UPI00312B5F50
MEYLIGAVLLGMLIWAGLEIVQTIKSWDMNATETNRKIQAGMVKETAYGQFGGDAVEGASQAIENTLHASHCAAETVVGEVSAGAIGPTVEGLMHLIHH